MVSDFQPDESYQFFLQEVPELLRVLESGFLNLHQNTDVETVWNLMCTTHSLKGGAACAGLEAMQNYAHQIESCLKSLADSALPVSLATEELLLQALDYLKAAVVAEIKGGDSGSVLGQAQSIMTELCAHVPVENSEQPEADVIHMLFEQDVTKGLRRLAHLLADETTPARLETFKTQVEILQGIGEIANLPGFIAIATTTLKALNLAPQHLSDIGPLALTDFTAAHALVIQGDREIGGVPSLDLKTWINPVQQTDSLIPPLPVKNSDLNHAAQESHRSSAQPFTASPSAPLSAPPSAQPILLSSNNDGQQWTTINDLIEEMLTLDSRLMAQHLQRKESLVIGERSFFRLKQLISKLQHRSAHTLNLDLRADITSNAQRAQKNNHLQVDLQAITEEISQLGEFFKDAHLATKQQQHLLKQHQKQLKHAQDQLLQAQMLPISGLLNQFPRVVRQLAQQQEKSIRLVVIGDTTLVDKAILEKLYEPLLHLLRNAVDHGIETTEIRQSNQKPLPATITIRARQHGYNTYIDIEDDGQGIDLEAIRTKVIDQGWLTSEEMISIPNQHLYDYLFQPNFTTTSTISQLSGRGMGLYAVRSQIHACQGSVRISSTPGKGTRFTLRLPFNTAVTKLLLFRSQQQLYALAVNTVVALTYATPKQLKRKQDHIYFLWKQRKIPLYTLFHLLTYRYPLPSISREALGWLPPSAIEQVALNNAAGGFPILIIGDEDDLVAFRVDEIISQQDLVVKPLDDEFINTPDYLQGTVMLGNGHLLAVLDGTILVERCLQLRYPKLPKLQTMQSSPDNAVIPTVMIVDDSLTIRSVLALTLHKNGYQVLQAKDGQEALPLLEQHSDLSAIICDIEMPHMSGLELLSRCRRNGLTVPIIMLTYRNSERYRLLAKQLGASAYLTKPYLDKELLQVLHNCLRPSMTS